MLDKKVGLIFLKTLSFVCPSIGKQKKDIVKMHKNFNNLNKFVSHFFIVY